MKKILVTGATGFIGNYVIKELLENNCQVIATSSNEDKAGKASWLSQVTYIPFDLSAFDPAVDYQSFFQHPDAVIHLAWEGLPNYTKAFHVEVNLPRHFAFVQNLIKYGLKDITLSGTCFEYGMQEGMLSETMEPRPHNPYGIAKNALREQLEDLQQKFSFHLKWIRLFYMYGEGQNPGSLLSQLDNALENGDKVFNMSAGEQGRDYLPVQKVAEYICKIALQNKVTGIINCCSGKAVAIKELVIDHLQKKNKDIKLNLGYYPYNDYEPMRFWGDNRKLAMILEPNKL